MRYAHGLLREAAVVASGPPASAPNNAVGSTQQPGIPGGATAAAASNSVSDSSSSNPFDVNSHFSPTMIVVLVILVSAFLFMGFFAFYVRRCMNDESFRPHRSNSRRSARGDDSNAGRQSAGRGVDPLVVEGYPTVSYVAAKRKGCTACSVCLCDFEKGEDLKQLPKCKHVFHPACVGKWLSANTTCPLCRRSVLLGSERWSMSWRWGGSGRPASMPSTGEGSSRSRSGVEIMGTSPQLRRSGSSPYWLRRDGSSMVWLLWPFGRSSGDDASSRCGRASQQDEMSVRVLDTRSTCELEPLPISRPPSSRHGMPLLSLPPHALAGAAAVVPSEVATHGLPVSYVLSEVAGDGLPAGVQMLPQLWTNLQAEVANARSSDIMPRGIEEDSDGMPRRCELCRLRSEVGESGRHGSREGSEVAAVGLADVAQADGKKPRALLGRWNSTGHSLRWKTAAGCMPFVLYSPRSSRVGGSRFANQPPRGTSQTPTSAGLATSNLTAMSATSPQPQP